MSEIAKLTKQDVRQFWKLVKEWQGILSLADWDIAQETELVCDDDPATLADVASFPDYKSACLTLYQTWDETPITPKNLRGTAIHELLHVLLSELMELAGSREVTKKQLADAEHRVIRALIRAFLRGQRGK